MDHRRDDHLEWKDVCVVTMWWVGVQVKEKECTDELQKRWPQAIHGCVMDRVYVCFDGSHASVPQGMYVCVRDCVPDINQQIYSWKFLKELQNGVQM